MVSSSGCARRKPAGRPAREQGRRDGTGRWCAARAAAGRAAVAGAGWWAAMVPAAYLGTILFHALVTAARSGDPALLGAAAAMPVMHLSWALGFLRGR